MFNKQNFGGQTQMAAPSRAVLESKVRSGASTLLAVVVFSLINCFLLLFGNGYYFLFSANLPYYFVAEGMYWTGRMEDAAGLAEEIMPDAVLYVLVGMALVMIALYLICFLLSKKHALPALIVGLFCFVLDTLAMFYLYGVDLYFLFDYILHAVVLVGLISALLSAVKLKKLPPDPPAMPGTYGFVPFADPVSPETAETPSDPSYHTDAQ